MNTMYKTTAPLQLFLIIMTMPHDAAIMRSLRSKPHDDAIMRSLRSVPHDLAIMRSLRSMPHDEAIMRSLRSSPMHESGPLRSDQNQERLILSQAYGEEVM